MISKPMLASSDSISLDELDNLTYPIYVTPKLDGIRCLIAPKVPGSALVCAFSRKLILLPNDHIQEWAASEGIPGMDGEITIPEFSFHQIQSWVMTESPPPISWCLYVFDWHQDRYKNYLQRLQRAKNILENFGPSHTRILFPTKVSAPDQLLSEYNKSLRCGHEGLILRSDSLYKQGRSTRKEGFMLKMKQFQDAEATIIDFEPEYENTNTIQTDNTGAAKRSSHKNNLKPRARLGALVVQDGLGRVFNIGSGFNHEQKNEIWNHRNQYRGQCVTYSYQSYGIKNLPRCPIFKGIRQD